MDSSPASLPTLAQLLEQPGLGLRLVSTPPPEALERGVQWVHGSDLPDPTPFLTASLVLMTTGTQYAQDDSEGWSGYVERLARAGVTALGFGTEVVRSGVPAPLAQACERERLPLFEIPFRTPFIAVARANAEAVTQLAYARRAWALAAQQAISRAALQPDGLHAAVTELARQVGAWVGLYNADGEPVTASAPSGVKLPGGDATVVAEAARGLLTRGRRAAGSAHGAGSYTLQTVGRGGALRGVLAVGLSHPDHQEQAVLASVLALLSLAWRQAAPEDAEHGGVQTALHAAVFGLLREGSADGARRVAAAAGVALEAGPLALAIGTGVAGDAAVALEATGTGDGAAAPLITREGEDVFVVAGTARMDSLISTLQSRHGGRWGISATSPEEAYAGAEAEARMALERGAHDVSAFAAVDVPDLLLLAGDEAVAAAHALLRPLLGSTAPARNAANDVPANGDEASRNAAGSDKAGGKKPAGNATPAQDGGTADAGHPELLATLRAWLLADGNHEAAARELGVHRHTVRARLRSVQELLGLRLDAFAVRVQLYAALRRTGLA